VAALLAARAVYAARDEALRIARAPLNFHHILGRKPAFIKAIETTDVEMEIEALKTKLDEYCAEYKMDGIDQKDSA
jgi:hypothetical protein